MTDGRGRHVASGSSAFIRDLVVMGIGIVIVGVLIYGGMSLIASIGEDSPGTSAATSTTGAPTTSSVPVTTTTTAATTTTVATTTTTAPEARDPSEVTVLVLNGTQRSGIAGALTTRLSDAGYQTLDADNYSDSVSESFVWYEPGFQLEAEELRNLAVPDATTGVYEGPDLGADIVVVLGATYEG